MVAIAVMNTRAITDPGIRGTNRRRRIMMPTAAQAMIVAAGENVRAMLGEQRQAPEKLARHFADRQAEEILDLRAGNQDRDAVGEADHNRPRNVFDGLPQSGDPQQHQHEPRHEGAHIQSIDPIFGNDVIHDDDKSAVGPAICTREPPNADTINPATMAVYNPYCGGTPDEMANAIANGSATRPTVIPAVRSAANNFTEYWRRQWIDFGISPRDSSIWTEVGTIITFRLAFP